MKIKRRHSGSEARLTSADGHRIRNIHISTGSKDLLILAHGITTEKNEGGIFKKFAEEIVADRFDSLRFDFRGHGDSRLAPIETTISGEILDLMTAIRWGWERPYQNVHLLAASFGASVSLLASMCFDLSRIRSLVMWNPVINYRNTFIASTVEWGREFFDQRDVNDLAFRKSTRIPETNFEFGPKMTVELLAFHPESAAMCLKIPFLILHGEEDSMVPRDDAMNFCLAAGRPNAYVEIPSVDHGFEAAIDRVFSISKDWLINQSVSRG